MSKGKKIAVWVCGTIGVLVLAAVALGFGTFLRVLQKADGERTGGTTANVWQRLHEATQVAFEPKEGFPGKNRLVILCMGIDDNWTNGDQVYTKDSRTDTLFLLSLDLVNHKATMLSIPRDTYAHIAGTHWNFKINAAYETGGPDRAIDTVNELLGVHADHYMVLNIDATKKMVDALGGVDVDVPHAMHYHDKWGHLSIDLAPGLQHLDGSEAVGFARYRHPDTGMKPTSEDGDVRRMFRQHMLLRAMIGKAKSFANAAQAPRLVDVGMSSIRTDLTRAQIFDLAAIFKGVQPDDIQTASLPGDDFRGPQGAWFYRLDMAKAHAYVDWLVRGDGTAARRLVPVVVRNGTPVPHLAETVVEELKANGYTDVRNGGDAPRQAVHLTASNNADSGISRSEILDTGVPNPQAAQDISNLIGLVNPIEARHPVQPNHLGWTPEAALTLTLGQDYAQTVKSSGVLDNPTAQPAVNSN